MKKRNRFLEMIIFALVSTPGTIVDMGIYAYLHEILQWKELASNALSFPIGVVISFYMNKFITFKIKGETKTETTKRLAKSFGIHIFGYIIYNALIFWFTEGLCLGAYTAKGIAILENALLMYVGSIYMVFNETKRTSLEKEEKKKS